jgi:threonylcarbamoyladenosine tRNA methylthiotransferase MtaB
MSYQVNTKAKFFLKTLGCKVNQYESQAMREILSRAGFRECSRERSADIFIINTCTVTHQADKEARYIISQFHKLNPKARIVVTGCYAENDSDEILALPGVFKVIGNEHKSRIAHILGGAGSGQEAYRLKVTDFKDHVKAFVKIQDGCENYCSYCKVPLIRPDLDSKPIEDIISEVKGLTDKGFKEIVLTGICLGAWGMDTKSAGKKGLVEVLKRLEGLDGNFRIRLSSIEPKYVDAHLIKFIARSKKTCRHLHIPLQSGDNAILKKMNRPYTARKYLGIIDKVKAGIKDVAITTDVLIGFPGESDRHFKNTLALIKKIKPLRTHIFTYSPRKGTVAYDMEGCIDKGILKKRYLALKTLAVNTSCIYRRVFLKRALNVLVETRRDKLTGMLTGYSDNYIKILFSGPDSLMEHMVPVKVDYVNLMYTMGKRCKVRRK